MTFFLVYKNQMHVFNSFKYNKVSLKKEKTILPDFDKHMDLNT